MSDRDQQICDQLMVIPYKVSYGEVHVYIFTVSVLLNVYTCTKNFVKKNQGFYTLIISPAYLVSSPECLLI